VIRALLLAAALLGAPALRAECRQALALALDVSGSVDAREYRLQLEGLATALAAPPVRARLLAMPEAPVRLLVFEWSGPEDHALLVPWTEIAGQADLDLLVETLRQRQRRAATPGTALGQAMQAGAAHLATQGACWKRTLDISGDGKSNLGPRPRDVKPLLEGAGITVNGLVVGVDDPQVGDTRQTEIGELSSYYRAEVILGPEAFVQTALGYGDYARAMEQKLLRELEGLILSDLAPAGMGR
jgi:hypothetical protein